MVRFQRTSIKIAKIMAVLIIFYWILFWQQDIFADMNNWKDVPVVSGYPFDPEKDQIIKKYEYNLSGDEVEYKGAVSGNLIGIAKWDKTLNEWKYRDAGGNFVGTGRWDQELNCWEFRDARGDLLGEAELDTTLDQWEYRDIRKNIKRTMKISTTSTKTSTASQTGLSQKSQRKFIGTIKKVGFDFSIGSGGGRAITLELDKYKDNIFYMSPDFAEEHRLVRFNRIGGFLEGPIIEKSEGWEVELECEYIGGKQKGPWYGPASTPPPNYYYGSGAYRILSFKKLKPVKDGVTTPETEASEIKDPAKLYKAAYDDFKDKKYTEAREKFWSVINDFPENEFTDKARFWIGESHYNEGNYEGAILAYELLFRKNPDSNKVPSAMLKQGLAFYALNYKESGQIILEKLVEKFPDSEQAKLARKKLDEINR